jgi:DNA-binding transcriptional LysR family regulator
MQPMPDWEDLKVFLEVARTGTLAAAGRKLSLDNTTVGRRLGKLEKDLAAKLFARTPDGLVLSTAGEAMRAAAEEMERSVLKAEQRALGADESLAGVVRVATTEMLGSVIVVPAIESLRQRHPQIRIDLLTGTGRLDLARREADVALRYVRPESGDLVSRRAGAVSYGAYATKKYLQQYGRPQRGDGFAGHDLILYDTNVRTWTTGLAGQPIGDARVVLRANSVTNILAAIRLGMGIGPLPCVLARGDKTIERVPEGAPPETDPLWLVLHPDVQKTSRVRAVIEALEVQLRARARDLSAAE